MHYKYPEPGEDDLNFIAEEAIDGGFRRGTDIFKALALGARAICIGRPYLWGLAAFGQPGVERVLEILNREFELIMRHAGIASLSEKTEPELRSR